MGSIFYSILAVTLLPFASLSLFIYDRQFYSGEAASKLYTSRYDVRAVFSLCCLWGRGWGRGVCVQARHLQVGSVRCLSVRVSVCVLCVSACKLYTYSRSVLSLCPLWITQTLPPFQFPNPPAPTHTPC